MVLPSLAVDHVTQQTENPDPADYAKVSNFVRDNWQNRSHRSDSIRYCGPNDPR